LSERIELGFGSMYFSLDESGCSISIIRYTKKQALPVNAFHFPGGMIAK
jgi:hypothetical protein